MWTQTTPRIQTVLVAGVVALLAGIAVGRAASPRASATTGAQTDAHVALRYKIPVTASQPAKGPEDALVTIVQWCDLRNPACARIAPILDQVLAHYSGRVRLVYRHDVDPVQTDAMLAAEFAMVAQEQAGKFWQVNDLLMHEPEPLTRERIEQYARQLALDPQAVRSALDGHSQAGHVIADGMFAAKFGVEHVPALFVDGRPLPGDPTREALERLIDDELQRATALVASGVPARDVYAASIKDGLWSIPKP